MAKGLRMHPWARKAVRLFPRRKKNGARCSLRSIGNYAGVDGNSLSSLGILNVALTGNSGLWLGPRT
ncbi:hypothetical protein M408DRAFT_237612 [Serendipita vermifera MAFF 305830]|uniref:Uncharacterized protein n=1 Tax=Serendipita vermifera MAFF 305830 TaxID=933852 RepID=A0A0C2X0A8_SERVB|nr:hypothetical protein M408DRAFT_237612 [Serendipita vermifera MAFF 305830]